jgi:hypothetical protein
MIKYRVQYFNDQHELCWSGWRDINESIKEKAITSLEFDQEISWERSNEIMREIMR